MKKSYWIVSSIGVCMLIGGMAIQPYAAMKKIEAAFASKDQNKLAEMVDFPELKKNLLADANNAVLKDSKQKISSEESAIFNGFADAMLTTILTPEGLIKVLAGEKGAEQDSQSSYAYEGLSRFSATLHPAKGGPLTFVLEREGLAWRLTNIHGFLDRRMSFPESVESKNRQLSNSSNSGQSVIPPDEHLEKGSEKFELQKINANIYGVLPGGYACINELSAHPTCVETGKPIYPAAGSKILYLKLEVRNQGETPGKLGPVDALVAKYKGRNYRYSVVGESENAVVQPLANGSIHAGFEVPVSMLNDAEFFLSIGGGDLPVAFERPVESEIKLSMQRAQESAKEDDIKKKDADNAAIYKKCWALQDKESPAVSRENYGWYVENCSEMYLVPDYDAYLRSHG